MLKSRIEDSISVLNGFSKILSSYLASHSSNIDNFRRTSQNLNDLNRTLFKIEDQFNNILFKNPTDAFVSVKIGKLIPRLQSDYLNQREN